VLTCERRRRTIPRITEISSWFGQEAELSTLFLGNRGQPRVFLGGITMMRHTDT